MREGWQTRPIGEVFRVVNGGTPKTGTAAFWDGPHQWVTPAEMGGLSSPYLASSRRTLTDAGLRVAAELLPPQSIILSSRAPIGHLVINEVPMAFNQGCKGLVPSPRIDTKFAYYFLLASVPLLESLGTGATFKELSSGKLKEVPFHFPPLPTQRRIVAILDEAFEAIARAKSNTEKNLQSVLALLASRRRDVFASLTVEHGLATLGRCCTFENGDRGKNYPGKEHRVLSGVPFINAGHLTEDGIDFSKMDYISEDRFSLLGNGKIKPRDILFCLRGSLGKFSCVYDLERGAIASSLVILRPRPLLRIEYLLEFLASVQCVEQIHRHKGGAAQPNLGAQDLKLFEIPLPPIEVQDTTASHLACVRSAVSDAKSLYAQKLSSLGELRRSLLDQALTGQLTAQSTDRQLEEVA